MYTPPVSDRRDNPSRREKLCVIWGLAFVAVALLFAGCGSSKNAAQRRSSDRLELRIYDANGRVGPRLTAADIIRSSARYRRTSAKSAALFLRFKNTGASKFHILTRELAHRGARLQQVQRFVFEVNHRVYARPFVDYRLFPNGLDGKFGIEVNGLALVTARHLVAAIR